MTGQTGRAKKRGKISGASDPDIHEGHRVDAPREEASSLLGPVAIALRGSPFEPRPMWPHALVVIRQHERPRVTSRGDFSHWLASNGLRSAANECMRRQLRRGEILLWIEVDDVAISTAQFHIFRLSQAISELNSICQIRS
jgi:hypothetical protein